MSSGIIRDWVPGDSFSAGHLNEALPTVRSVRTITGDGGVEVFQGESGTSISLEDNSEFQSHFLCLIVNKGPSNEVDYTDARYWCRIAEIIAGKVADAVSSAGLTAPPDPIGKTGPNGTAKAYPDIITATNLAELTATSNGSNATTSPKGSHSLSTNTTVLIHVFGFADQSGTIRYVFAQGGSPLVWVKLTSSSYSPPDGSGAITLGVGRFAGEILSPATAATDLTTDLVEADVGSSTGQVVVVYNMSEVGLTTRNLTATDLPYIVPAVYWRTLASGAPVYLFFDAQWSFCTS